MPVYNAERYVQRAVESVVLLSEVGELIIVDDGSTDCSLALCKNLERKYNKIRVFTHKNKKNRGISASRNIGIKNSKYDFISFLDADDYYLPNRFQIEKKVFLTENSVDGVYGFALAKYASEDSKKKFLRTNIAERTTLTQSVPPGSLFKVLILGGYGSFHTSTITVRKRIFRRSGLFNEKILYGEDTELWYRMSLSGKLVSGSIRKPIAIRWVHELNSIHAIDKTRLARVKLYSCAFNWAIKRNFSFEVHNLFFIALHRQTYECKVSELSLILRRCLSTPSLLFSSYFFKKVYLILIKRNAHPSDL